MSKLILFIAISIAISATAQMGGPPMVATSGFPIEAKNVTTPGTLVLGQPAIGSYTSIADEDNEPPGAERVVIAGTADDGNTLTAVLQNFVSPNGASEGSHIYRWYRSFSMQATGTLIIGSVSQTYTIHSDSDASYRFRVEVDPVQSGPGENLTGNTVYSVYTTAVPSVDWAIASGLFHTILNPDIVPDSWAGEDITNPGTAGGVITQGDDGPPTWSAANNWFDFAEAGELQFAKGSPTRPVEVWVIAAADALTSTFDQVVFFNANNGLLFDDTQFKVNGVFIYTIPNTNLHLYRYRWDGASGFLEVDEGSPISNNDGANTLGSGNILLGSNGTGGRLDGKIQAIYYAIGSITGTDETDMYTYINAKIAEWNP